MARRRGRSFERVLERTEFSDMRSDSWEVNQNSEFESVDSDFDYDFEKDGIREGDNIRDPEGNLVLDLQPNEVSGVDFSQDDEAQFSNSDTFLDDVLDIDEEYKIDSHSIPDPAFMESDMPLDDKKLSPPKVKTRADSRNN